MNRAELEHIIRAAGGITGQSDLVVVGSQALLAQFPNAPAALLASMEADIYPRHRPDLSIQIDGAIGERSLFHQTFGYYAHGVDESTATLPPGWQERLVPIHNENTGGATGWCLEVHDLAASKLAAGRQKDLEFVRLLVSEKMVSAETLARRVEALPLPPDRLDLARHRLRRLQLGS
jgi:Nucleotidyltransferase of unknown function (DUF6036)